MKKWFPLILLTFLLTACGFKPQGAVELAPPLKRMYLKTNEPYSYLSRRLRENLKLSKVKLVDDPSEAQTILVILNDEAAQQFLSVNASQQTRQYKLTVTVTFEITDNKGRTIVPSQSLSEDRTLTVQSNVILGSSNEANLFYLHMRRDIAYAIMNRIASKEITHDVMTYETNLPAT